MANTKTLNSIFGRKAIVSARPDPCWPLPSDFVGIEVEVENYDGDSTRLAPEWAVHSDGSLRNGIEFVTASPIGGEQLSVALTKFFNNGHRYTMGPRTSVHVHINASDEVNVDQFRNMLVLVYVIEPGIFRWADDNRKWCGYCAPLTEIIPSRFVSILNENNDNQLVKAIRGETNHDRYFGFNMSAYAKHGTVEFRYFPCTNDRELMAKWIKFVMYVKRTAMQYDSVAAILSAMEGEQNLRTFMQANFADVFDDLWPHIDVLDTQSRVKDILAAVHVIPRGETSLYAVRSLTNPVIMGYVQKNYPDREDILNSRPDDSDTDSAYKLINNLIESGYSDFDAYQRVAVNLGHRRAMAVLNQVQMDRRSAEDERARRAEAAMARRSQSVAERIRGRTRRFTTEPISSTQTLPATDSNSPTSAAGQWVVDTELFTSYDEE